MITLDFTYRREDCVKAYRLHFRGKLHLPLDLLTIAVLAGWGGFEWHRRGPGFSALFPIGIASLFALLLFGAFYVIPFIAYRRNPRLRQPYRLVFSDERIVFSTTGLESKLDWPFYDSVLSGPDTYILYYGKNQFTTVPKRVFAGPAALKEFETLLRGKITRFRQA